MTLDTTQILILALIAAALMDKAFAWYVVHLLAGGQRAPTFPVPPGPAPLPPIPVPDPGPLGPPDKPPVVPDKPPVTPPVTPPVPPVTARTPRNTHIVATSFAGTNDSTNSKTSAYTGKIIESSKPAFAVPKHLSPADQHRTIRGFWNGKSADGPPADVGPWYDGRPGWPIDPYWETGTRPRAETDNRTNHAGIDATPGFWRAVGHPEPENAKDFIDWDWVDYLNTAPVPLPPVGPAQPPVGGTVLQHNVWPTQAECPSFYGDSEAAIRAQLVTVHVPWLMNGKTQTIEVHRKCADSLTRIVNYIWEYCGKSQDKIHEFGYDIFDGSFNWRYIAGTQTPSVHSYGAAVDFNAAANPIRNPGKFKPESLIVHAFTQEGWIWLGPTFDPMHFQAARVR